MSKCCSTTGNESQRCPRCGQVGQIVGAPPVRPHLPEARDGAWQYCGTTGCLVVYYLDAELVDQNSVITQVDFKAIDKPTPVCFCFAHTADDLEVNGDVSAIKAGIKSAVANSECACEYLNPSRKCCLADVHRALKNAKHGAPA